MAMKKFIDITDFSREDLRETLNQITYLNSNRSVYANELAGKTVVEAFYEDDEYTAATFTAAAARMGGMVVPFGHTEGISFRDEIAMMSACGDVIVIKHPLRGAARAASLYATVPVINAGDGGRAYPVRTLADISSVWCEKKHVSNMNVGFLGDFSDNPCARNLLQCLNLYKGNEFYFVSVNGKPLSDGYVALMDKREKPFSVYDNLFDVLPELDVLYITKVEKDSFDSEIMYEARKHNFILDERMLLAAKPDLLILHPFPRGVELNESVDSDSRAAYFRSMNMFTQACMVSYIKTLSNKANRLIEPEYEESTHEEFCGREDCITSAESYLPRLFHQKSDGTLVCKYCGRELKKDE